MSGATAMLELTSLDIGEMRLGRDVATTNYGVALNYAFGHWHHAREARRNYWQARDEGLCEAAQRYRLKATWHTTSAMEELATARFWKAYRND